MLTKNPYPLIVYDLFTIPNYEVDIASLNNQNLTSQM